MNEKPQPDAPTAVKPPVIRMDRSRDFGTVHGDRPHGDAHYKVAFYQDGLPYDPQGLLMLDHPDIVGSEEKQAKVMRLIERSKKLLEKARGERDEDDEDEDEDEDGDGEDKTPIDLKSWARGEQKLQWQLVTNAIAQRFAVRVSDKRGALELLIVERVVTRGQLSREHQRLLQD